MVEDSTEERGRKVKNGGVLECKIYERAGDLYLVNEANNQAHDHTRSRDEIIQQWAIHKLIR